MDQRTTFSASAAVSGSGGAAGFGFGAGAAAAGRPAAGFSIALITIPESASRPFFTSGTSTYWLAEPVRSLAVSRTATRNW